MPTANEKQVGGSHYKDAPGTVQYWDFAWGRKYDPFQFAIGKYVDRHKRKGGVEDLKKALHYLEKYIELIEEGEKPCAPNPLVPSYRSVRAHA